VCFLFKNLKNNFVFFVFFSCLLEEVVGPVRPVREEMAQNTSGPSVPRIGLANTVRFSWRENEKEPWGRETFGTNILLGYFKLKVKDVLCLQGNPIEKGFDVTFFVEEQHDEVMKKAKEEKGEGPLCHYAVTNLGKKQF
jgi:hypothetical protein